MARTKFNISILGESYVGKTSLVEIITGFDFNPTKIATVGIEHSYLNKEFDGEMRRFQIFDTAGQEKYHSLSASTIQIADGYILVFDVGRKDTLQLINKWINYITEYVEVDKKVIIIIGNKIDIENREISEEEGKKFAQSKKVKYFETSAKDNIGVEKAFNEIIKDIYELNKNLEKDTINIEGKSKKKLFCSC